MSSTTMCQVTLFLVLALSCCSFTVTSSQNNSKNSVRKSNAENDVSTTPIPIHYRFDDARIYNKNSYDYDERGHLVVEVEDVTATSLHVKWSLPELKYNDSVLESSVVCELPNGFRLSKKQVTSRAAYRLENLDANTNYVVCVYMLEKSKSSNTRVLHYNCQLLKTNEHIPSLRTDSIVAVVITLGYITAMIIIGYATWRWKRKMKEQDEAKQKLAIEDDEYDEEDGMINGGLRDNNHNRGGGGGGGGSGGVHGSYRGVGGGSHAYSGSVDTIGSRKERDNPRSSNHDLNNLDRSRTGSKGNNVGSVAFSDSDVVLERKSNSAEEVNGCLDLRRNSRGSGVKLTELSEKGNTREKEKKRPKSHSLEDSPVKVTEITF